MLLNLAYTINDKASSLLAEKLPSRQEYAVAAAMLLGVREELDHELLRAYSAAGAIHTLSVSGMHVGILFLVLSWLLTPLRKGSSHQKWLFASIVTSFLWGYALVTGLSGPVLRSAIMLSVFVWSDTFRLSRNAFNTLAFSAFLILLFSPYSLFQMGFQLSYLSVAGIMYLYPKLHWLWKFDNPLEAELWSLSCGAVAAQVVTYPLAVYYFHQFPTYFLVVNPLVMAFSSLGLIVGMAYLIFASVPVLSDFLLYVLKLSFGGLNVVVKATEHLPGALWNNLLITPMQLVIIYGVILMILLLFLKRQKAYLWGGLGLVILFSFSKVYAFTQHRQQQIICIHHLKKHTAISLIKGRKLHLLADSALYGDTRTQSLHLVPFWINHDIRSKEAGITPTHVRPIPYGNYIEWQSRSIVWLHKEIPTYTSFSINQSFDILLLTNNAIRYPGDWLKQTSMKQVVLDVTNSKSVTKRWIETCRRLRIPCYDIRTSGAFVYGYEGM
ncbi:ComEC/Rec2 family competence protein [Siphonobacter sp. SORGH_AS_1065]|uniref:ComEC/Rec2 family competence protein n=1 Tax=Siphonobacter sp. SORGH_AS_1065 TaxID=3041795 RepID=UPI0027882652|nr:ComEC/Rec2 family competence protein [Siphonobacter sp. SORGH_AS_1065]MDQ1089038.1 competence protein ComEC [Siphonobacter sp. SORGH_AS_1065]